MTVSEHELKAAVLFRAAKFIEWPSSAFARQSDPFVMCLVGDGSSLAAFDGMKGKLIGTHRIDVRRVTGDMLDLRHCHAAFFPDGAEADVDYALGKLTAIPVLTVGETRDFALRGGMLALIATDQRVRFTVNLPATKKAGLSVSSQLLQLASVIEEPKP